jgi:hypothetical protein
MKNPDKYKFLSEQGLAKNLSEILNQSEKPTEARVLDIYEETAAKHKTNEHLFELYKNIQKSFPFFSSRDIRNIQSAVSLRLTDFDLPEDWFNDPALYFKKDYDTKFEMLKELMKGNMKGLDFSDVRRQETVRYLDNLATIADTDFKRKVDGRVHDLNVQLEASKIFEKGK